MQDAEDIFQEALVRVMKKETLDKLVQMPAIEVRKIIFGYVRNIIREWLRGEIRRHPKKDHKDSDPAAADPAIPPDIASHLFNSAWEILDDEERTVFELYYLGDNTQAAIADVLDCAIGRVNAICRRVESKFYSMYERICEEYHV